MSGHDRRETVAREGEREREGRPMLEEEEGGEGSQGATDAQYGVPREGAVLTVPQPETLSLAFSGGQSLSHPSRTHNA